MSNKLSDSYACSSDNTSLNTRLVYLYNWAWTCLKRREMDAFYHNLPIKEPSPINCLPKQISETLFPPPQKFSQDSNLELYKSWDCWVINLHWWENNERGVKLLIVQREFLFFPETHFKTCGNILILLHKQNISWRNVQF